MIDVKECNSGFALVFKIRLSILMLKSIKDNISAGMKALKPSPGVSYFPFVYLFPLYHSYFIYM